MSKTPFSADYIHKLLKTIPEAERSKFLEVLETQPIIEQQPASGSAATPALAAAPQPAVTAPQTLDEFCDTVAQEAYVQPPPAAPVAPPPQRSTPAPTPSNNPAGAAAQTATPAASKTPGSHSCCRCPRFQSWIYYQRWLRQSLALPRSTLGVQEEVWLM